MFSLVHSLFQVRTNQNINESSSVSNDIIKKKRETSDIMALVEFPIFLTENLKWSSLNPLIFSNAKTSSNISSNRVIIGLVLFLGILIYPVALTLLYGFSGFVITYQLYYKYSALKAGDVAWGMLKYNGYHVHHWMYCSIILLGLWLCGLLHPFFIGLCFGGIIHGIQYPDWHQFHEKTDGKCH
jgi:hypothetical protein